MGGASRPEPIDNVTGSRCPAGSTCIQGVAAPLACVAGKFNPNEGSVAATGCANCYAGYYCSSAGTAASDTQCPAGYLCAAGTATPTAKAQPGHYAPKGSSKAYACPPGTYQPDAGKGSCNRCTDAHLCDAFGLSAQATAVAGAPAQVAPPTTTISGTN